MPPSGLMLSVHCLVLGGGVAGVFSLAEMLSRGMSALLLESDALGAGQTRCSQGIIHGGVKYSLGGLLGGDSRALSEMPGRWLRMAEGSGSPPLGEAAIRARFCWLWRSDGVRGRLGMLGAKLALRARPEEVPEAERPELLRRSPGGVLRLPEPIVDPCQVLAMLAAGCRPHLASYQPESLQVLRESDDRLLLRAAIGTHQGLESVDIEAGCVLLAAGAGNEALRKLFSRAPGVMQRRPLHQVILRSRALPMFDGHCVDGDTTRVTVTSARDDEGRVVWHLGGRLAEEGVALDRNALLRRAEAELRQVLPDAPLDGAEFAAYRIDRAEAACGGRRPEDVTLIEEGRVLTLWPTKLALAPRAADLAADRVLALGGSLLGGPKDISETESGAGKEAPADAARGGVPLPRGSQARLGLDLPPPPVAGPPWHDALEWTPVP